MYKSPQSKIGSLTETVILIGCELDNLSSNPIIVIAPEGIPILSENSNGHISSSRSGDFRTSPRTILPKNIEITTGNKKTTKAMFRTANSNLTALIPLYLFSNDKSVQDNYVV